MESRSGPGAEAYRLGLTTGLKLGLFGAAVKARHKLVFRGREAVGMEVPEMSSEALDGGRRTDARKKQ